MDSCHARDQYTADCPGHGKNYFFRKKNDDRGNTDFYGKPSPERKSAALCCFFSEAGGYFLWNALQKGLFKQRADTEDPGRRRGTGMWEMLPERALLGGECF